MHDIHVNLRHNFSVVKEVDVKLVCLLCVLGNVQVCGARIQRVAFSCDVGFWLRCAFDAIHAPDAH